MNRAIYLLMPLILLLVSGQARGQSEGLGRVDSILDRLERRLLDQEAGGLTFDERTQPPAAIGTESKVTRYQYGEPARVEASTTEQESLRNIGKALSALETQVDQLASDVQKTKQGILDEAAIDNFISIDAELAETDTAAIKSLSIKLDGYPVYELREASGLWLPSKAVPLYAGPLQPGSHRLDLEARLVVRHRQSLPMTGDVYRFINKSFELIVPGGVANTRYVITITPPAKLGDQAQASLKSVI